VDKAREYVDYFTQGLDEAKNTVYINCIQVSERSVVMTFIVGMTLPCPSYLLPAPSFALPATPPPSPAGAPVAPEARVCGGRRLL